MFLFGLSSFAFVNSEILLAKFGEQVMGVVPLQNFIMEYHLSQLGSFCHHGFPKYHAFWYTILR